MGDPLCVFTAPLLAQEAALHVSRVAGEAAENNFNKASMDHGISGVTLNTAFFVQKLDIFLDMLIYNWNNRARSNN